MTCHSMALLGAGPNSAVVSAQAPMPFDLSKGRVWAWILPRSRLLHVEPLRRHICQPRSDPCSASGLHDCGRLCTHVPGVDVLRVPRRPLMTSL